MKNSLKKFLSLLKPIILLIPVGIAGIIAAFILNLCLNLIYGVLTGDFCFKIDFIKETIALTIIIQFTYACFYFQWYRKLLKYGKVLFKNCIKFC